MTAPVRVQRKREKGWRKPEGAVMVTRPSPFANPYLITKRRLFGGGYGDCTVVDVSGGLPPIPAPFQHLTEEAAHNLAVECYARWIEQLGPNVRNAARMMLGGKDLGCWCRPGLACHVDHLLSFVNTPAEPIANTPPTKENP